MLRIDGQLVQTTFERLSHESAQALILSLMTEQQRLRWLMGKPLKWRLHKLPIDAQHGRRSHGQVKVGRASFVH